MGTNILQKHIPVKPKYALLALDTGIPQTHNTSMIAETIKRHRERLGLTQAELGALAGMTQPGLSKVEKGKQSLEQHQFFALAEVFGVHPSELFGDHAEQEAIEIARTLRAANEGVLADWIQIGRRLAGMK